jgi:superfamily II DNA or RNA helicase/SAM-dependent methyltransferase
VKKSKNLSFKEHQKFAKKHNLKTEIEWVEFCRKNKPDGIYISPDEHFKKTGEWNEENGWGINLGTVVKFLSFKEHQKFAKKHNLKTITQWINFYRKHIPDGIYRSPDVPFKKTGEWPKKNGWSILFGKKITENLSFKEHQEFAKNHNLTTKEQWVEFCRKNKPDGIYISPDEHFKRKNKWAKKNGWPEFLGTVVKFLSFKEHQKFAKKHNLKNAKEWNDYCKKHKPIGITSYPDSYFKKTGEWPENGWSGLLRTDNIAHKNKKFLSFKEHQEFAKKHNLTTTKQWEKYWKKNKPDGIASGFVNHFKKTGEWPEENGTAILLGTLIEFLSFKEHQEFAKNHNLTTKEQWIEFCRKNKPDGIASYPDSYFKKTGEWPENGWSGLFGKKITEFLSFKEHQEFAKNHNLTTKEQWIEFCRKNKPDGIAIIANNHFKKTGEWPENGWSGLFGKKITEFLSFKAHQEFAKKHNLTTKEQWNDYCKKHKPIGIISHPDSYFKRKNKWAKKNGWPEFLGTGKISYSSIEFLSFKEHQEFAKKHNLTTKKQWLEFCRKNKPDGIAINYESHFKKTGEWPENGTGILLGTGTISNQNKNYYPFYEAKIHYQKYAKKIDLQNLSGLVKVWEKYYEKNIGDTKLPKRPEQAYSIKNIKNILHGKKSLSQLEPGIDYYYDWYDTFGLEDPRWSSKKIIRFLKSLLEDDFLLNSSPEIIADLIEEKGLDKIYSKYVNLLKLIPSQHRNKEFSEYIKKVIESKDKKELYEINKFESGKIITNSDEEILVSDNIEIHENTKEDEIIPKPEFRNPGDVLEQAQKTYDLRTNRKFMNENEMPLSDTKESYEYYLRHFVNDLWHSAFHDKEKTIQETKKEKSNKEFRNEIRETFLDEYNQAMKLKIPLDYDFKKEGKIAEPTLMQRYFALMVQLRPYYANFSGTGAGKTIAALLASRINKSKMNLIVCPNGVVDQWKEVIKKVFPKSKTFIKKDVFSVIRDNNEFQYLIINYEQFQQQKEKIENNILKLASQKIDFVNLDEIHFSKTTSLREESKRRIWIDKLLSLIRERNPKVKVIGLSATPIVNNLVEGRSLIELISGQEWSQEIKTKLTMRNARKLHKKFTIMSLREDPEYDEPNILESSVTAKIPLNLELRNLNRDKLVLEQLCTQARIPKIIEIIKKNNAKTVIYTEFIGGRIPGMPTIIEMLKNALDDEGIIHREHTGEDHSGHKAFVENKKIKVLIATRPISTGVDDLQNVCNNLIFNNLPWTHALYTQIIGRLIRKGQKKKVNIHHVLADVEFDGKIFVYDKRRIDAIINKKNILDCAVSGVYPESELVNRDAALNQLRRWIEQLQEGRRLDLLRPYRIYDLKPQEVQRRVKKYGDFEIINKRWIKSTSDNNFKRIQKNPEEWYSYHSSLNEKKKKWSFDPNEIWAEKISKMKKSIKIGDFGCGEAILARRFGKHRVFSFDMHPIDKELVVACNIKSIPLKDESIDIAVYNLSLMGYDWEKFLDEAKRLLRYNGRLFIADTEEHLKGYLRNLKEKLEELDFQIYRFEMKSKFVLIEAIKD